MMYGFIWDGKPDKIKREILTSDYDKGGLTSRDGWAALPHGTTGLSAVCDCGISWTYSFTILEWLIKKNSYGH